ncbi:MAG: hypothetical protein IPF53_09595 [Blastocatellia bacterium]|nr:hypothetical protein [Blastocatellia bacterium]
MATKSERGKKAGKSGRQSESLLDESDLTPADDPAPSSDATVLAHSRFAMTLLFVALAFGIVLETLHGFKAVTYLMDPVRKEFWSLAHFHGIGLALVNLVYSSWAGRTGLGVRNRSVSLSLMAGSVLLPLGFFLAGIAHYGSDPGLGIFLAPVGAALVLYAIGAIALTLWKR